MRQLHIIILSNAYNTAQFPQVLDIALTKFQILKIGTLRRVYLVNLT
jgi:hypothetical protein